MRNWCIENVKGGEIVSAALSINWDAAAFKAAREKRPVPADSVHATFSAHDVAAQLLAGAPLMAGMEGGGVLTGNDLTITGSRGYVDAEPGKRIQASDISFIVPDLKPKPLNPAHASARFEGGADALVEIISRDPLKHFVGVQSDFATAKGHFDGKLTIDMKLGKTAKPDDAIVSADVAVNNVQLDKFIGAERFDQGAMTVSIDHGAMKIVSQGKLFGAEATLTATKGPTDDGVAEVAFTLDEAGRAKRGLAFGAAIAGPIGVKIKTPLGRTNSGEAELDLSRVSLDNLLPGLVKPAGKPAKATFAFKNDADGLSVSNLSFDGGGASIKGAAQFSNEGGLIWAKLNQVRLSPGDDLKADVSAADSVWKITVRGATLDGRPVLKGLFAAGQPSDVKNYDLDVKVGSILGANRQAMNQVDMAVVRREGQLRQMRLSAQVGGGPLTVRREESGNLLIQGADAGALLKFCDLYARMEKGSFSLVLKNGEGRQEGVVEIKDFVLRNEPALRQLVTAGQTQASNSGFKVDPDVASFEKLTGQFSRTAGRIDLHNALIYDQQMGLTAQGFIDYSGDRVDLSGTFVPAYQVNNLITHVPFIGMILGGGAHEGLFAINYRISGPATAPNLSLNVLSAVTPGFLRKIFGVFDGTAQAPDDVDGESATRGFTVPDRGTGANMR